VLKGGFVLAALVVGTASSARAHVTLERRQVSVGSYSRRCSLAAWLRGIADRQNPGAGSGRLSGIQPMPKQGWTVETVQGKDATEYDFHGGKISEGFKEVVWSGGRLADDNYDEFNLEVCVR
jgi:uncharacterized protein YcnI